ncbi:ComF family protein [Rudaea cellulosilytica]|uniref:ComF family protein n=1 Tax=Rudaea cellulosilytica TaxID=540746 RepID=UPI00037F6B0F|nr:ComF family protein [Rudaea cellulosilytica]
MNTLLPAVNPRASSKVDGLWRRLQFALLPPHCLLCGARGETLRDLCRACLADLAVNHIACARCALPLAAPAALCGECLKNAPAFDTAFAPYLYGHPLDLLLTKLKFGHSLAAGRVLAELWTTALRTALDDGTIASVPDFIVPVPLHPSRLRERGYNQALELAKPLAREFGLVLAPGLLRRTRATAAQSDLDAVARRKNLRSAFEVDTNHAAPAHVALLDDVMTTGTTLREAARTLKRAGVARVDVWVLARAPHRH